MMHGATSSRLKTKTPQSITQVSSLSGTQTGQVFPQEEQVLFSPEMEAPQEGQAL